MKFHSFLRKVIFFTKLTTIANGMETDRLAFINERYHHLDIVIEIDIYGFMWHTL